MARKKELDITKTGPVGYKTLQGQNNATKKQRSKKRAYKGNVRRKHSEIYNI